MICHWRDGGRMLAYRPTLSSSHQTKKLCLCFPGVKVWRKHFVFWAISLFFAFIHRRSCQYHRWKDSQGLNCRFLVSVTETESLITANCTWCWPVGFCDCCFITEVLLFFIPILSPFRDSLHCRSFSKWFPRGFWSGWLRRADVLFSRKLFWPMHVRVKTPISGIQAAMCLLTNGRCCCSEFLFQWVTITVTLKWSQSHQTPSLEKNNLKRTDDYATGVSAIDHFPLIQGLLGFPALHLFTHVKGVFA